MSCDVGEVTESMENELFQPFRCFTYVTVHSPTFPLLHLGHNSFCNPSVALRTSQLILQSFRCFTYVTVDSPTLPLLHLRHSSFSNTSFASPTSQALHLLQLAELILQPFRHSSFSNPSVASPMSQFILQHFFLFSYTTSSSLTSPGRAHSPTFPSLHLRHNSFCNPSVALRTSQLILQPFRCFTYVTSHSPTLLSLLLRHKLFT